MHLSLLVKRNLTGTEAAKQCGMPLSTFRYKADAYEKELAIVKYQAKIFLLSINQVLDY